MPTPQPTQATTNTTAPATTEAAAQTTMAEMVFIMACYCYIHGNALGYPALEALHEDFIVMKSLSNPEIAQNSAKAAEEVEGVQKETEVASSAGAGIPDIMDEEPVPPGGPTANADSTNP